MQIRFAEMKDVPGILSLLRQVGQLHHQGRPDVFRSKAQKYSASQVIALISSADSPVFVAEDADTLLGYAICFIKTYLQDPVFTDRTTLYMDDLCVAENCRGQRIGTALYEAVCKYAQAQKYHSITLNVWACNEGAVRFYEGLGMTVQKMGMEKILNASEESSL